MELLYPKIDSLFLNKFGHRLLLFLYAQADNVGKSWKKCWDALLDASSTFRKNHIFNSEGYYLDFAQKITL